MLVNHVYSRLSKDGTPNVYLQDNNGSILENKKKKAILMAEKSLKGVQLLLNCRYTDRLTYK